VRLKTQQKNKKKGQHAVRGPRKWNKLKELARARMTQEWVETAEGGMSASNELQHSQ